MSTGSQDGSINENDGIRFFPISGKNGVEGGSFQIFLNLGIGGSSGFTPINSNVVATGLTGDISGDADAADFTTLPTTADFRSSGTITVMFGIKDDMDSSEDCHIKLSGVDGYTVLNISGTVEGTIASNG